MYRGIKYFELQPVNSDKKLIVNIDDSIRDINKKLRGIINKKVDLDWTGAGIINKRFEDRGWSAAQALKTDIQLKLKLKDRLKLKNKDIWSSFLDYRYGALQLPRNNEIDALVITDIDKGKIVTEDGDISIHNIFVTTKLFGRHVDNNWYKTIHNDEMLENIQIRLIENMICFIKYNQNNKSDLLSILTDDNIIYTLSNMDVVRGIHHKIKDLKGVRYGIQ